MKSKLLHIWSRLRSSYWFVPSLMALGAIVLSLITIQVDRELGAAPGLLRDWVSPDPASARAFLTTVAGSMITVAGVVFSITMVALTLASSQFGSRLLENFMRDRGNQVVLGTFIATFLYCLLVLRAPEVGEPPRVSEVSLAVALLLTLGSLAVFIYFIHHAAVSIQVPNLAAEVARDLERAIDRLVAGEGEELDEKERQRVKEVRREGRVVVAQRSAYIDSYEASTLFAVARRHGLLVVCVSRPGRFVVAGRPVLRVLSGGDGEIDPEGVEKELRAGVLLSHRRRPEGDVEFQVEQLVELAVRALSPGINDPFTAVNCTDLLAAALAGFAQDPPPPTCRRDDEGELRLVLPQVTLEDLLAVAFNQIRQYGRGCTSVTLRLLERLADLAACARTPEDLEAVLYHAEMVRRGAEALPEPHDREAVEERWQWVQGVARRGEREEDRGGEEA